MLCRFSLRRNMCVTLCGEGRRDDDGNGGGSGSGSGVGAGGGGGSGTRGGSSSGSELTYLKNVVMRLLETPGDQHEVGCCMLKPVLQAPGFSA